MSNTESELDLTSPEFINELTPEQIAAAGQAKKYNSGVYFMRNTAVSLEYSKPRLNNGELNADASGSVWLQLELMPVKKTGGTTTKLSTIKFVRVFFYERLTVAAMTRAKYTAEQIAKVQGMGMPNTYDGFAQFARAIFPERFGSWAQWNNDAKKWTYEGNVITNEQAKAIQDASRDKVLGIQREIRSNPKSVQGKEAFWSVFYEENVKGNPEAGYKHFPTAAFPYAATNPPKDKNGVLKTIQDPEA